MQQEKIDKLNQNADVLSVRCTQHTLSMFVLVCKQTCGQRTINLVDDFAPSLLESYYIAGFKIR